MCVVVCKSGLCSTSRLLVLLHVSGLSALVPECPNNSSTDQSKADHHCHLPASSMLPSCCTTCFCALLLVLTLSVQRHTAVPDGEIHVTLKDGKPYSLWNIVSLAHHATQGMLTLKTTCVFHPSDYSGGCYECGLLFQYLPDNACMQCEHCSNAAMLAMHPQHSGSVCCM